MTVSAHSKDTTIYIYSVFQSNISNGANLENHIIHTNNLKFLGIPYQEVDGAYKGVQEKSIVITNPNVRTREVILKAMDRYNQGCILILDDCRHGHYRARLDFLNMEEPYDIGTFRQVPRQYEEVVKNRGDYTILNGVLYTVTPFDSVTDDDINKNFKVVYGG